MSLIAKATVPRIAVAALVVSLALIAGAHAFEIWGGLPPCPLCLRQREAHWTAAAIAALAFALSRHPKGREFAAWPLVALALVYAVGAGIAAYHVGVEWGLFEAPASCAAATGPGIESTSDLLRRLQAPAEAAACDQVGWSLFGITLAGYNLLISLALAGLAAAAAWSGLVRRPISA